MPYLTLRTRKPESVRASYGMRNSIRQGQYRDLLRDPPVRHEHGAGPLPHACAGRISRRKFATRPTRRTHGRISALRAASSGAEFAQAIGNDRMHYENARDRETRKGAKVSLMVTHLNETGGKILCARRRCERYDEPGCRRRREGSNGTGCRSVTKQQWIPGAEGLRSLFDHIYTSDTPYAADIRRIK
jgi:hypothetical protein